MMAFRSAARSEIGIDMTPMIDCVFQLLIFFLLSSSFLSPSVRLQLPRASAGTPAQPPAVVLTVDASNQLFLNTVPIAHAELSARLAAEFRKIDQHEVVLRADRTLSYDKVMAALLAVQRAGSTQVHLAYENEAVR